MFSIKKTLLVLMIGIPCIVYAQVRFDSPFGVKSETQWSNKSSKVQCVLSYAIKDFGRADFTVLSGSEKQYSFELFPLYQINHPAVMRFIEAPNNWQSSGNEKLIGKIDLYKGYNPYVGNTVSLRMLSALNAGKQILMPYTDQQSLPGETIVPAMSSMGFEKPYRDFVTCTNDLIKTSFKDIAMIAVIFEDNSSELIPSFLTNFQRQIEYIKYDEAVNSILIRTFAYGHIDDEENKALAQERADALIKYFADAGINTDMIETEFFFNNSLSPQTEVKTSDMDSRKATIQLGRDEFKVRRDHEIKMPDIGLIEEDTR